MSSKNGTKTEKTEKTEKAPKAKVHAHAADAAKAAKRIASQAKLDASGSIVREPTAPHAAPAGGAPVKPLSLAERAQLGDKKAQAQLDEMAKKFDEVSTKSGSAATQQKLAAKAAAKPKAKKAATGEKKQGCAFFAEKLLRATKRPMDTHEMLEELRKRGWWDTQAKKPADVIFGVIVYDIKAKGKEATFVRTEPGKFYVAKP